MGPTHGNYPTLHAVALGLRQDIQRKATKMVKDLEHSSYGERLRGWDGSAWRRLKGDLMAAHNCLKEAEVKWGSVSAPREQRQDER